MCFSKLYRFLVLVVIGCCSNLCVDAQSFRMEVPDDVETIPFELFRNLVVVRLKINGQGPYNFALDTGVGYMLITEPSLVDSIGVRNKHTVKIHGLGEGKDFEAYITESLSIDLGGIVSNNVNAALLKKDVFGLSAYAGRTIHGLLGYEFFSQLAVKFDFFSHTITIADPKNMRYFKRAAQIPISIEDRKPYLVTDVTFADGTTRKSKLVIDMGAGHFISLEHVKDKDKLQPKQIKANLGIGINGSIKGCLSRIKSVKLGKYEAKSVIAAFPDSNDVVPSVPRDGNLGIGLLRKFDIIFDYPNNMLYLKPGAEYRLHDEHDMSGINYYTVQDDLMHVIVDNIEPGSAASYTELEKGDQIVMINIQPVADMSLQQIDDLFKSKDGRPFLLLVLRGNKYIPIHLTLKRRV